jgi:hypothetical protein
MCIITYLYTSRKKNPWLHVFLNILIILSLTASYVTWLGRIRGKKKVLIKSCTIIDYNRSEICLQWELD